MFADPLANVTYATVGQTLPRVASPNNKGMWRKSDGTLIATISHQTVNKLVRSVLRLDRFADVVGSDGILEKESAYVVIERPVTGFSLTDTENLVTCLTDLLQASSKAAIGKLYNQES